MTTSTDIRFGAQDWEIQGTLTIPNSDTPVPAVVLVHGSGPHDRDETMGPNKPFRDMAEGLAQQGIASLRFDKRTFTHDTAFRDLEAPTLQDETIDDAVMAYDVLRGADGINADKVFIIGHSLGGMAAPRILQAQPSYAGAVILAANARPLEDLILAQIKYQYSQTPERAAEAEAQIPMIEAEVAKVKDGEDAFGVPASYWQDLNTYNQVVSASASTKPLFIAQGDNDCQISAENDFSVWQESLSDQANATVKLYPKLNHLLMPVEAPSTGAEYAEKNTVSADLIRDIAAWILEK